MSFCVAGNRGSGGVEVSFFVLDFNIGKERVVNFNQSSVTTHEDVK